MDARRVGDALPDQLGDERANEGDVVGRLASERRRATVVPAMVDGVRIDECQSLALEYFLEAGGAAGIVGGEPAAVQHEDRRPRSALLG